jgi:LPXTG-site transpeptidase (sortase) family protein
MRKRLFSFIIIIIYFSLSIYLISFSCEVKKVTSSYEVNNGYTHNEKILEVPKINLKLEVIKANDNFENLDNNLVYYNHFNPDDKIIIFGHSGVGFGTYFNRLDELNSNDKAYLIIDGNKYHYYVTKVYEVSKNATYILKNEYDSKKLLLVTCVKGDKNKRLVVELSLNSN